MKVARLMILPCPLEAKECSIDLQDMEGWAYCIDCGCGNYFCHNRLSVRMGNSSQMPPVTVITTHCTALSTVGGNFSIRNVGRLFWNFGKGMFHPSVTHYQALLRHLYHKISPHHLHIGMYVPKRLPFHWSHT